MMLGHLPEFRTGSEERSPENPQHISIRGLAIPPRVPSFDLEVRGGLIVGLAGQVGCGASEVLRALAGLVPNSRGDVELGGVKLSLGSAVKSRAAGVFFSPSDRKEEGLFLTHSIVDNLVATRLPRVSRGGFIQKSMQEAVVSKLLSLTGIARERRELDVGVLSGGNQQKVLVARGIDQPNSKVLLFDEPARGVDVGGRADIHELIRGAAEQGNVVIFHSTDLDEVFDLADVIVTMFAGRLVNVRTRAESTPAAVLTDMTHGEGEISA
jgi:ABC-type sugar transport system ATPase subunit